MSELGKIIAGNQNTTQSLSRAVVTKTIVFNYIGISNSNINIVPPNEIWEVQGLGNHFTLDHPVNGELDSATLELDTGLGFLRVERVLNFNNDFREYFRDEVLIDSSSTATIDTSADFDASFTSGQILLSEAVYKEDTIVNTATPSVTVDSGSVQIELSNDSGSTWNVVSNNTQITFPFVDFGTGDGFLLLETGDNLLQENGDKIILNIVEKELMYRLTEDAASTAAVSFIKIVYT